MASEISTQASEATRLSYRMMRGREPFGRLRV
jgi:hypothetical protein